MSKIRIYLKKEIIKDQKIFLDNSQIHYLKNVMRRKDGDNIVAFNESSEWECVFNHNDSAGLIPLKLLRSKNTIPDIWLCFSLVKSRSINNLVEKISEIGVQKIVPLSTDFSERIGFKLERLKKISIEATEQSNSMILPKILEVQNVGDLLENWDKERLILFCDENGGDRIFNAKSLLDKYKKFAIFIGPIGGWSKADREIFKKKTFFRLSLGENILKADTAAIYSLSCLRAIIN